MKDEPSGAQRRVQTQVEHQVRKFYITKGTGGLDGKAEFELLYWDNNWIWRGLDTSPGAGRFYVQYEAGNQVARWCPRFMKVGQDWVGFGHRVQFFLKSSCGRSDPNSGPARNRTKLFRGPHAVTFNGLSFADVVHLGRPGGEEFWFARGIGMIAWKSEWNASYISERHSPGSRPNNVREKVCSYTLP